MALAINIDDLLNKQRIESNRIEFKKGWNPVSIYHSVCAFANDFDDLGGGYIVVGVDTDDKTGVAIRPVEGIPIEEIDDILQDMVGYNNKIAPYYRLLREYLVKVGSKLASEINIRPLQEILEQMDLFVGPKENRMLRNVAAMMFCENPSKFFKRTQVEIVYFPEGRLNNPSNLYEGAVIKGSVPQIIDRTLEYLKRMLVMQSIIKPENDYRSRKFYTYPYQALEESVTNSLYHRDYREWEPVVITVEPDSITIQNVGGPDRSISAADISRCDILVSKRYRNRRLGEYLKELDMTEGRSTGIPTIQNVLENNGSPRATVVTDEDRTFFRITIPCHEAAGNIIADIAHKDASVKASRRGARKSGLQSTPESTLKIIEQIQNNPQITMTEIANVTGYSRSWVAKTIKRLQEQNIIKHVGSNKNGYWEIITK